jgi:CelD/BcsL family acetyltransferase involved in cellulose biosynthesis
MKGPESKVVLQRAPWRVEVVQCRAAIAALEPAYEALFESIEDANPFLAPQWVYPWMNTLGRRFSPCFLVCYEESILRGVWPFIEQPVPLLPPLLLPAAAQVADLFDPVAAPSALPWLQEALLDLSRRYLAVWLPLLSERFVEGGFRQFFEHCSRPGLLRRRTDRLQIDLRIYADFDAYLDAAFQKRTRQGLQRKLRRLERSGTVEFRLCREPEEMERHISKIVRLERASWKHARRSGIFKDPGHHAFYFLLLQAVARKKGLWLGLLHVGEALAAFEIGVIGGGTYHMHAMAFDPQFAAHSPGRLLSLAVVRQCFEEGISVYDFLQNDQDFKRQMANRSESFWDGIWVRGGVAGRMVLIVVRLLDRWKSGRGKRKLPGADVVEIEGSAEGTGIGRS